MNKKRMLTLLVVLLIISAIVFTLFKNKKTLNENKIPVNRSQVPVTVTVDTVKMMKMNGTLTLPATLTAWEEANISAETSGRIENLTIELGSMAYKGQLIGHIDDAENRIKLESAELAIEKLNRDYERNKILVAGNATNANAVKDAQYDLDSKKLEAAQLRSEIAKANIICPITGIITEKKAVTGELVNSGSVIASLADTRRLKAKVYVPENHVFVLKAGEKARIATASFPGETFEGVVTYISPKGDDNHNYLVELAVTNNKQSALKAGLYVQAVFDAPKDEQALQIPKAALAEGLKNPYVYVDENNIARESKLVLGRENGEYVEVVSGLKEGEKVITSGLINILPGSRIEAVHKN
jgi:RND family efflux transporter MFP subunit